ncbi:hypothetical protein ACLMJK_008734 [Lecanora helva]
MTTELADMASASFEEGIADYDSAAVKEEENDSVQKREQDLVAPKVVQDISAGLENLQNHEQRRVLDVVAQVRKCGLDGVLSLPQLVVCGDQSAGKSSVLEALTEIPFPRSDNLCTRFATEIILRQAPTNSLAIKIIPDDHRPSSEKKSLEAFHESITDFQDLPRVMGNAKAAMEQGNASSPAKAFARDVLSFDVAGPTKPQLTLVDIPGLIQTDTKVTTKEDVALVEELTDSYISEPRTICLAVVSAAYDCANQKILTKVREVDKPGDRTLGIITKPDLLPHGSGTETAFLELAQNQDIFFKLGWHVIKNRKFEETDCTLIERKLSEDQYFRTSNFKKLPESNRGIGALQSRLSGLLFEHIKKELPQLRADLEQALSSAKQEVEVMGASRTSPLECKGYLIGLSVDCRELCRAAVNGHYEGRYFTAKQDLNFDLTSSATIRRIRAVVQHMNIRFAEEHRTNGHRYHIDESNADPPDEKMSSLEVDQKEPEAQSPPIAINKTQALAWARQVLIRNRGKELVGNFNPLLVGELLWDQCVKWRGVAIDFLDEIDEKCNRFLDVLLEDRCPKDLISRLGVNLVQDQMKTRYKDALEELEKIVDEVKSYPINYNHLYTDTINKRRQERQNQSLSKCIKDATNVSVDVDQALTKYNESTNDNMENVSCEEALDCLHAIYEVQQPLFVANITTQVIERHMIRGLEVIFDPVNINKLSDEQVLSIVAEPPAAQRQRAHLEDKIKKLEEGQRILRRAMGGGRM